MARPGGRKDLNRLHMRAMATACCPFRALARPDVDGGDEEASVCSWVLEIIADIQHPLDLLMRMSPLAFVQCVIYGWYTGELDRVRRYGALHMTQGKAMALLMNGVIAFGLNIVSFTANKKAGALTMTVAAKYVSFVSHAVGVRQRNMLNSSCKQVMTIALAVFLFNLTITFTTGIGILLTFLGGVRDFTPLTKQADI